MHAIDTNVLVRLVTRDDAKQVAAAEAFVENGAWEARHEAGEFLARQSTPATTGDPMKVQYLAPIALAASG